MEKLCLKMFPNVHERACYEHSKSFRFRAKKEGKKFAESFPHDGGAEFAKNGEKVQKNRL